MFYSFFNQFINYAIRSRTDEFRSIIATVFLLVATAFLIKAVKQTDNKCDYLAKPAIYFLFLTFLSMLVSISYIII